MSAKKSSFIVSLIILTISICSTAEAKYVYAITDHHATQLSVYEILGDQIEYWDTVDVADYALGASDVSIDSRLKRLFITYESYSGIVWANTETMEEEGSIDVANYNLAGIVADEIYHRVYAVERSSDTLYICEWYEPNEALVLIDEVTLTDVGGAWGMAQDRITRRLYVTNNTTMVHYYDADDPNWTLLGTRDVGRAACDITVDFQRGYLYTGALYRGTGQGHNYLVKHDLEDPCESTCNVETDIGTVPIGVAVDSATGLVYVTTSNREVRVYDCSGPNCVCTDSKPTGGTGSGPAGICVGEVGPCWAKLTKVDDVNDGDCVGPGDEITYTICYSYTGDSNCPDINDVNIIDELPEEVEYCSSGPYGIYNSDDHTVTWNIGTLKPGDANCVTLKVEVKECTEPGGVIINCCEMKSGDTPYNTACEYTPVCCPMLTKVDDVNDCVGPGDNITYSICYAANGYGDTNVVITDDLPPELEFVSATGNYEHISGTVTWDIGTMGANDSDCLTLTVEVKCPVPNGIITNSCQMQGDCINLNSEEYTPVCGPPTLTKVDDVSGCVGPGDEITYDICYAANGYGDNNVVITDSLPPEVNFVSANGDYEYLSGTITWDIGTMGANDSNCLMLTVEVKCPVPNGIITNSCQMQGDCINLNSEEYTPVCGPPTLTKVDDVSGCVGPGDNITYSICYVANGYGDSNVVITDSLPSEVNFVSVSDNGIYNPDSHAITWDIGTMEANDSNCLTLTVDVKSPIPGDTITNSCQMQGDCINLYSEEYTPVCCCPTLIKVDDVPDGNFIGTGDIITYTICYDANGYGNTIVDIVDYLPEEVNYVSSLPTGDYNDVSHTVTWYDIDFPADAYGCIELVVEVNTKPKPCGILRNCCEIKSDEVVLVSACEDTNRAPETCEGIYACGWALPADKNGDCRVNFLDFVVLGNDWWRCIEPDDASCEKPWLL